MHPCLQSRAMALPSKLRSVCQLAAPLSAMKTTLSPKREYHFQNRPPRPELPDRSLIIARKLSESRKKISESTILLQEGTQIQEVPMAILKSNACGGLEDEHAAKGPAKPYIELDPTEEAAFVEAFSSYHTPQEVLRILDTIPSQEVTPFVAFSILKKLFELESNFGFRNEGRSWVITSANGTQETFARAAIIGRLMNIIMSAENSTLLLDTLDLVRSEKSQLFYHDSDEFMNYRNRLCECILVRVTEGKLTLLETCRAVCSFGQLTKDQNFSQIDDKFVDKMWVGIMDKSDDINADNIVNVFKTVQYFTKCQRLVCGLVERNLKNFWGRVDSESVALICDIIGTDKKDEKWTWCIPGQIYSMLSKSTALNMHQVMEGQLLRVIKCFYHKAYCDHIFRKALAKYVKAKWMKITKPELVVAISEYSQKFRLSDPSMLDGISEYVIAQEGKGLSPPVISAIINCFGYLNFQPRNGHDFWNIMERLIDEKFVQFTPKDLVNIFIACTYLQKYPLNFINRIFSPYFLDRIHGSETNFSDLQLIRSRLKLLDTSLHIECGPKYGGPYLPKDYSVKNILQDGRISRTSSMIAGSETIQNLCESQEWTVLTRTAIPSLPLNDLYIADVVMLPVRGSEIQVSSYFRSRISDAKDFSSSSSHNPICFLMHVSEHYTSGGALIGPQVMRKRQLQKLGFHVVSYKVEYIHELTRNDGALEQSLRQNLIQLGCSM